MTILPKGSTFLLHNGPKKYGARFSAGFQDRVKKDYPGLKFTKKYKYADFVLVPEGVRELGSDLKKRAPHLTRSIISVDQLNNLVTDSLLAKKGSIKVSESYVKSKGGENIPVPFQLAPFGNSSFLNPDYVTHIEEVENIPLTPPVYHSEQLPEPEQYNLLNVPVYKPSHPIGTHNITENQNLQFNETLDSAENVLDKLSGEDDQLYREPEPVNADQNYREPVNDDQNYREPVNADQNYRDGQTDDNTLSERLNRGDRSIDVKTHIPDNEDQRSRQERHARERKVIETSIHQDLQKSIFEFNENNRDFLTSLKDGQYEQENLELYVNDNFGPDNLNVMWNAMSILTDLYVSCNEVIAQLKSILNDTSDDINISFALTDDTYESTHFDNDTFLNDVNESSVRAALQIYSSRASYFESKLKFVIPYYLKYRKKIIEDLTNSRLTLQCKSQNSVCLEYINQDKQDDTFLSGEPMVLTSQALLHSTCMYFEKVEDVPSKYRQTLYKAIGPNVSKGFEKMYNITKYLLENASNRNIDINIPQDGNEFCKLANESIVTAVKIFQKISTGSGSEQVDDGEVVESTSIYLSAWTFNHYLFFIQQDENLFKLFKEFVLADYSENTFKPILHHISTLGKSPTDKEKLFLIMFMISICLVLGEVLGIIDQQTIIHILRDNYKNLHDVKFEQQTAKGTWLSNFKIW